MTKRRIPRIMSAPPPPLPCAFCDSPDGEKWHRPACVEVAAALDRVRVALAGTVAPPPAVSGPTPGDERLDQLPEANQDAGGIPVWPEDESEPS